MGASLSCMARLREPLRIGLSSNAMPISAGTNTATNKILDKDIENVSLNTRSRLQALPTKPHREILHVINNDIKLVLFSHALQAELGVEVDLFGGQSEEGLVVLPLVQACAGV